jgi:hypothetical protein
MPGLAPQVETAVVPPGALVLRREQGFAQRVVRALFRTDDILVEVKPSHGSTTVSM